MKKVLSLVLVIAMVLSSFSFALAAPKFEDVTGDYTKAVETLAALGVINGYEDGTFRPEKVVTRAEMAKLIVEILGYGDLVAGSKSNFADTQGHWADPWIALAAGRGLVVGTGDGKFTPDRQVSYDEAITMVVRALGYTDSCNEIKNMTWPTNFKVKAAELKLLNKVKTVAGGADRGGVAQLLYNALEATLVTVTTDGDVTALYDTVEGAKEDRILLSRLATKVTYDPVNPNYVDPEHKDYKGDVVDLLPYMYQEITVYEKDDVAVFVKSAKSLTITGTVKEATANDITVEDDKEDKYTFVIPKDKEGKLTFVDFMYNGEEVSNGYDHEVLAADEAKVTVVLKGESGDKIKDNLGVLAVVATQASGYIMVEDTYVKSELTLDAIYLPKDGKVVDTANLVIKGDADSLEDIKEDDVLAVFVPLKKGVDDYFETSAANKMTIIVSRETVEGKITKISGGDYYISGKAHGLNTFAGLTLEAGNDGTFYLDHEGNIFEFKETGSGGPKNYALVLDTTNGYQTKHEGVVLADPKVKLLTAAGEEITYVLDIDLDVVDDNNTADVKNIVVNLAEGQVVKYDLDKNKVIDELEVVNMGTKQVDIKTDVNSFNLAKNAVIFNLPSGKIADTEDADVIEAKELDSKIDAYRFRNTKGEIEILVVTKGGAEVEGVFALITKGDSDKNYAYDEDTEKQVILYTTYVDGVKVEYLKHKDGETVQKGKAIVELTVSSGKLKGVKPVDAVTGTAINARVTNSITATNDKTYFLADDVVVYVFKDTGAFDKVGTKSDIRGKNFAVYDTIDAGDGDYDIVVVWP